MEVTETPIKGLKILTPIVFQDSRGYFFESYNRNDIDEIDSYNWVQDNESKSTKGVLRGLHYQTGDYAQAKLVRSIVGEIFDVAVDIRPDSPSYGQSFSVLLSGQNKKQLLIPKGFAHGFLVLSDEAIFSYKCDNYYKKDSEGGIIYNDGNLDLNWPVDGLELILSDKDRMLPKFGDHKPIT